MGILQRVEAFLERLFEAPAGRLGARLQPVSLAKRIERAMDTTKSFRADGVIVPNEFDLHLSPADYRDVRVVPLGAGGRPRARRARPVPAMSTTRWSLGRGFASSPTTGSREGDVRVAARVVDDAGERLRRDTPMPVTTDTIVLALAGGRIAGVRPAGPSCSSRLTAQPPVRFDLGGPLITVGRASDNDVIVDDPLVSRHHCQLKLQHGAYGFVDLGSRNGSSVNGQAVREIALGPGDQIRIGNTSIEFGVRG